MYSMKFDKICKEIKTCRICNSHELKTVIDLGDQFLASIFIKKDAPTVLNQPYPLELVRCSKTDGCGLLQLKHSISPDILYYDYGYRSGINELMRENLSDIAKKAEIMADLHPGDTVLDIGCNDGTLLESYRGSELNKVGFDPAENVAKIAEKKGFHIINDFFSAKTFQRDYQGSKPKVITSIAMFYDLEKPMEFVNNIFEVLAEDGLWVIELSYLPFMLKKRSYDTICHEHLEYYTLRQIEWMLERKNLLVHKIEFNDINGGSFRLFIRKKASGDIQQQDLKKIVKVREDEKKYRYDTEEPYQEFTRAVSELRDRLKNTIEMLNEDGKKIFIYGASTKGNTILQYCGIDERMVIGAAERNSDKWGRKTLGTNIPIISEEQARSENPDYFLVLPWHFIDVFIKRERAFIKNGGKFILPLPDVKIIGEEDIVK